MGQKYYVGDRVEVIANGSTHGLAFGTRLTVKSINAVAGQVYVNENSSWYRLDDLQLLEETKEKISELLKAKELDVGILKDKLSFMEETGKNKFNTRDFKKYQIKKTIEDTAIAAEDKADYIQSLFS
jgi:hypothetical protein